MDISAMQHPVPVSATFNRKTGEIKFKYMDDLQTQIRFGQTLIRMAEIINRRDDVEARKAFEARMREIDRKMEELEHGAEEERGDAVLL